MIKINIKDYNTANTICTYTKSNYVKTNTIVYGNELYVVIEDTYDIDKDIVEVYVIKDVPIKYTNVSQLSLRHLIANNIRGY